LKEKKQKNFDKNQFNKFVAQSRFKCRGQNTKIVLARRSTQNKNLKRGPAEPPFRSAGPLPKTVLDCKIL
jgi:hypothetical protein